VTLPDVIVVDDSKVTRDMIVACLRPDPSLLFVHAASGLEAIEQLSLRAFQLMVLDLNMPDIGGLEVLEFVRGRARTLQAVASRFMTKPFEPELILAEARALLAQPASA
jgi:two-component system chemotaxis response regulator CheY